MTDMMIQDDVLKELRFEPKVNAAHIGVAVNGGAVTLVGHVGSFAEKSVAILAARRINGVTAVIDELEVRFMEDSKDTDEQIAQRAFNVIRWDAMLPPTIKVTVRHGLVMLSGLVDWYYQRVTAEENVRGLAGIKGVINEIIIAPTVNPTDVRAEIENALKRYAEVEAESIRIRVQNGSHVILEGKVRNWGEHSTIETAAWSAPGVQSVDNRLTLSAHQLQMP
jgi:osmotically-inducible protein OsmY